MRQDLLRRKRNSGEHHVLIEVRYHVPRSLFPTKDTKSPSLRALARSARRSDNPAEAARLYTQAGEAALAKGKSARAQGFFQQALQNDAACERASMQLQAIYLTDGSTELLLKEQMRRLQILAGTHTDTRILAMAYRDLAITSELLKHWSEAFQHYKRAFELNPALRECSTAARCLALKTGQLQYARELLEQELLIASDRGSRAQLLGDAAIMERDYFNAIAEAIELLEQARSLDPSNVQVHRELIRSLRHKAEESEDLDLRARCYARCADLLCDLTSLLPSDEHLACLEEALALAPEHVQALTALDQLVPDDRPLLLKHWQRHIEVFPNGPISDELRARIASHYLASSNPDGAVPWLEELARGGDEKIGIKALQLHLAAGRDDVANAWLTELVEITPTKRRLALAQDIFESLWSAQTKDPAWRKKTLEWSEQVLLLAPSNDGALRYYVATCEREARWNEMVSALEAAASVPNLSSDVECYVLSNLATVRAQHTQDLRGALQTWQHLVKLQPDNEEAHHACQQLAEQIEDWDVVAQQLNAQLTAELATQASQQPTERERKKQSAMYRKLAMAQQRRGDQQAAAQAWLAIVELDEQTENSIAQLETILKAFGPQSDFVDTLRHDLRSAPPSPRKIPLVRVLAELLEQWEDWQSAVIAWQRILEADPGNDYAFERSLRLAMSRSKFQSAIALLRSRAQSVPEDFVFCQRKIAKIAKDRLFDVDYEIDALIIAFDNDQSDVEVGEELYEALSRAQRYAEQSDLCRRLADSAHEPNEARKWKQRLAKLRSRGIVAASLFSAKPASQAARRSAHGSSCAAEHATPPNPAAPNPAAPNPAAPNPAAPNPAAPNPAAPNPAEVADDKTKHPVSAATQTVTTNNEPTPKTRADEPEPATAKQVWNQIVGDAEDISTLQAMYVEAKSESDPQRIELILEKLAKLETDPDRRRSTIMLRAQHMAEDQKNRKTAIAILCAAESPDSTLLDFLEALCVQSADHASLVYALERRLGSLDDDEKLPVVKRIVNLCEGMLTDRDKAFRALSHWERLEPEVVTPRVRLLSHFARRGQWRKLLLRVDVLSTLAPDETSNWIRQAANECARAVPETTERREQPTTSNGELKDCPTGNCVESGASIGWCYSQLADRATTPAQKALLLTSAARAYKLLQDYEPGCTAILDALKTSAPDATRLQLAEELTTLTERWDDLARIYDHLLTSSPSAKRKALATRHAKLLSRNGQKSAALDRLIDASATQPLDSTLLHMMETLASASGRLEELFALYVDRATLLGGGPQSVELMLRATKQAYGNKLLRDKSPYYLSWAITMSEKDHALFDAVESAVLSLQPSAQPMLTSAYQRLTDNPELEPQTLAHLFLRRARLSQNPMTTLELLERAAKHAPNDSLIQSEKQKIAVQLGMTHAVDAPDRHTDLSR